MDAPPQDLAERLARAEACMNRLEALLAQGPSDQKAISAMEAPNQTSSKSWERFGFVILLAAVSMGVTAAFWFYYGEPRGPSREGLSQAVKISGEGGQTGRGLPSASGNPAGQAPLLKKRHVSTAYPVPGTKSSAASGFPEQTANPVEGRLDPAGGNPASLTEEAVSGPQADAQREIAFTEEILGSLISIKDPQDMAQAQRQLDGARTLFRQGRYEEAARISRETVEKLLVP